MDVAFTFLIVYCSLGPFERQMNIFRSKNKFEDFYNDFCHYINCFRSTQCGRGIKF